MSDIPYSNNVIFMDTEFTDLDIKRGELMAIGMVKPNGEELYLEVEYTGEPHEWVKEHVIPYLKGNPVSRGVAQSMIREFIGSGEEEPYLMSYVNQFDAMHWYQLFGSPQDHPAYWIPIDFASILFGYGFSPNSMGKHTFYKDLGIDKSVYQEHNALEDAKLLRDVYQKFTETVI